mmetsp:Transcript_15002/g.23231  ORF Transcript_15002/g.23231 Transcript_15002/m.23231 type:complete len:191 (+) Transcript_15002:1651-2223(+)
MFGAGALTTFEEFDDFDPQPLVSIPWDYSNPNNNPYFIPNKMRDDLIRQVQDVISRGNDFAKEYGSQLFLTEYNNMLLSEGQVERIRQCFYELNARVLRNYSKPMYLKENSNNMDVQFSMAQYIYDETGMSTSKPNEEMISFYIRMFSTSKNPKAPVKNKDNGQITGNYLVKQQYLQAFFEKTLSKKEEF